VQQQYRKKRGKKKQIFVKSRKGKNNFLERKEVAWKQILKGIMRKSFCDRKK